MLKTQEPTEIKHNVVDGPYNELPDLGLSHPTNFAILRTMGGAEFASSNADTFMDMGDLPLVQESDLPRSSLVPSQDQDSMFNFEAASTWDMIALGLEEPLPDQEIIDEMYVSQRARQLRSSI